jgi:hypothetical protein
VFQLKQRKPFKKLSLETLQPTWKDKGGRVKPFKNDNVFKDLIADRQARLKAYAKFVEAIADDTSLTNEQIVRLIGFHAKHIIKDIQQNF